MHLKLAIALYCVAAGIASQAQSAQAPAAADPAASEAAPKYESAFSSYTPYQEQSPGSWRELNEEVGKAGGHVGIFGGGHAGHGAAKPPASAPKASVQGPETAGQPPLRGAPAAPAAKPHH